MSLPATVQPAQRLMTPADPTGPADGAAAPACQLLRFTLGRCAYAVDIGDVQEIQQVGGLTAVPMLPAFVRGVMNLRGSVVPVIDLAARLGLGHTRIAPRTCVVVVEIGHRNSRSHDVAHARGDSLPARQDGAAPRIQRLGMLVDAVHEVLDVGAQDLEAVPTLGTRLHADFIRAMARVRGQIVEVLDLEQALDQDQLSELIGLHVRTRDPGHAPGLAPGHAPALPALGAGRGTAPAHPAASPDTLALAA